MRENDFINYVRSRLFCHGTEQSMKKKFSSRVKKDDVITVPMHKFEEVNFVPEEQGENY